MKKNKQIGFDIGIGVDRTKIMFMSNPISGKSRYAEWYELMKEKNDLSDLVKEHDGK